MSVRLACCTGLLVLTCRFGTGSADASATLTLVQDGRPNCLIVTNGRPADGISTAANELQDHLRLMSGATVPIVKENALPAAHPATLILVGRGNLAAAKGIDPKQFKPEEFVVQTMPNTLLLVGDDRTGSNPRFGTLWAVYDFLQDQLGCRWLWPGEIGRVVPRHKTITVADLNIRETPRIQIRGSRMANQAKHKVAYQQAGLGRFFDFTTTYDQLAEDERVWLHRMRMGRSFKLSYGHAFTDWWVEQKDKNPDLFALQPNGRRGPRKASKPDFVKMCVSNPKLWELQLAPLKKYAKQGARGLLLNACENDGSGGFCVCPRCRSWDTDPNAQLDTLPAVEDGSDVDQASDTELPESLSNRYARWYEELAIRAREIDPEAKVIAYAYSRYRSPPTRITRLESNIWIGYVGFNAYPRSDEYAKMSRNEWLGWSRLGPTVFLRSNSLFYYGEGVPLVATGQMADDLRFQIANGLRAVDYDNLQGNWATSGPAYYVLARMLWDTNTPLDELLNEYYGAFGPMRDVVRAYFEYWERFTDHLGNDPKYFGLNRTERLQAYPTFYTQRILTDAGNILQEGRVLLPQATEEERQRFKNIELGLQHGELLIDALRDGKVSNGTEGQRLLKFRRDIAKRNVVNVYWTTSKEMRYRVFD